MSRPLQTELLSTRLDELAQSLGSDSESVAAGASEILDSFPGQPQALFLVIAALKLAGAEASAREILEWMSNEHPNLASIQYELGNLLARLGMAEEAIERFSRAVEREPHHPAAWRALGNQLALKGDPVGARRAHARHARLSLRELRLVEDARAMRHPDQFARTERMIRRACTISPTNVWLTRLLGELYLGRGKLKEAEATLERALNLAPGCTATRNLYCVVLQQLMEWRKANAQLEIILASEPDNVGARAQMAANLAMLGQRDEALRVFDEVRPESDDKTFWLKYGQAARTIGKDDETIISAYHRCVRLDPAYGTAWWSLADLKTYRFSQAEIATMREQLRRDDLPDGQRAHLEFALGRALEDEGDWAESFTHYQRANERLRPYVLYNADSIHNNMKALKAFFTTQCFDARSGAGCPAPDPIFIVGMPRAGSTLIEQILASHSRVEGTMELTDLNNMVGEMIRRHRPAGMFPRFLADLDAAALRQIGEDYLRRTRSQRKLGRPFFTDKSGNNFLYTGLIHLVLPNAKIVDARRHPLACGLSCYKQAFAPVTVLPAHDQIDIARYYRDYVETMAHFDRVLPGRVHRVFHEELVHDPEQEIRRLLSYCNLPFEEQCLRFHETDRSIRTPSAQQVRQPIRKKSVEAWQHYEAWLQPMKNALGDVLTRYPDVPVFD